MEIIESDQLRGYTPIHPDPIGAGMGKYLLGWAMPDQIRQAATDLRAAAEYIETNGWAQGVYEIDGRCCAAGSINRVTGEEDAGHFNSRSAVAAGVFYRVTGEDVATYNDAPGRSKTGVIAKLRQVADQAEVQLAHEETTASAVRVLKDTLWAS